MTLPFRTLQARSVALGCTSRERVPGYEGRRHFGRHAALGSRMYSAWFSNRGIKQKETRLRDPSPRFRGSRFRLANLDPTSRPTQSACAMNVGSELGHELARPEVVPFLSSFCPGPISFPVGGQRFFRGVDARREFSEQRFDLYIMLMPICRLPCHQRE